MSKIATQNLSKRFGDILALADISFAVPPGSVTLLLGPSGAGKTTLLRLIAGLEQPDSGRVRIDDNLVSGNGTLVPPHQRKLAFVFQRPTLWPHMNAVDNVALALAGKGSSRRQRRVRAEEMLQELGMSARLYALPAQLSGGEMQRVSLARALVGGPEILLLDEPFAALDPDLRKELTAHLAELKSVHGVTMLWVTHRHDEATALADQTLILREGRIVE